MNEIKVVKGLPVQWAKCSRTVTFSTFPLALSYQKNTVAVGLGSGDISILDAITGSQRAILSGHNNWIRSVAFSPDGVLLASGSDDKTVKLWDVQTGGMIKTFFGHTDCVQSVSISADSTIIASGSGDKTIHLWNIQTGECHCVIEQQAPVYMVNFSPVEPGYFVSGSNEKIWYWNINGSQVKRPSICSYIAFSPDGTHICLCNGKTATIKHTGSSAVVTKCQAVEHVHHCCFTPDSRLIAAFANSTAYVWDITGSDPHPIETFVGHIDQISALAFSSPSSLITASWDGSVKFWQIGTSSTEPVEAGPMSVFNPSANIISIAFQVKEDIIITSDGSGILRIWDISTGHCKESFQTPAADCKPRHAQLVNGRLIIAWYTMFKVKILDVEKQELLWEKKTRGHCRGLKISEDGSMIFFIDVESIQAWSMWTGEVVCSVAAEIISDKPSIVDGPTIWVYSSQSDCQGWRFENSVFLPIELYNTAPGKLHPGGTILWNIPLCRIQDVATGKLIFQLPEVFGKPYDVQWKGQHLFLGFEQGKGKAIALDCSHIPSLGI